MLPARRDSQAAAINIYPGDLPATGRRVNLRRLTNASSWASGTRLVNNAFDLKDKNAVKQLDEF
jgi:hypothetical protein